MSNASVAGVHRSEDERPDIFDEIVATRHSLDVTEHSRPADNRKEERNS